MASKSIEYANETTLMCYNAKGWRDHLEKQWDELLAKFDFDGLYIDHWINIRHCTNSRHGCGGYLGSFATEGYHDFARRARRVVARHTDGKGIMLLNANMLLFSGMVPWFDIRLNGENDDPLKMREETIVTTWNGWGQGVQSLAMWRPAQDTRSMINLMTTFAIPFRLGRPAMPRSAGAVGHVAEPEAALAREFWGIWRFFGLNGAEKFSSFDTGDVLRMSAARLHRQRLRARRPRPGGDGRAGRQGRPGRQAAHPGARAAGPEGGLQYRITDLRNNRYLGDRALGFAELGAIPVRLYDDDPLILLVEPSAKGRAWCGSAARMEWMSTARERGARMQGEGGAPVPRWNCIIDTAGQTCAPTTPDSRAAPAGDFTVFAGAVPEDGVVRLGR